MTLLYFSTCLLSLWKRVHIRSFSSESWFSILSILSTSVFTVFLKGERDLSRVFTLYCDRDLAILAFSSLFLYWIALMVSSCFLFLGCRVERLFLGRFSFWRLSFWRRRPSLLRCLANAALCLGSSCDAGGLSSGSDSRFYTWFTCG